MKGKRSSRKLLLCFTVLLILFFQVTGSTGNCFADQDDYEPDDTYSQAGVIVVDIDQGMSQEHNFHDAGDEDWVRFYAIAGEKYTIQVTNAGSRCDAVIDLYDTSGVTLISSKDEEKEGSDEFLEWIDCPRDGIYYVRVRNYDSEVYGEDTEYELIVKKPVAISAGVVTGRVTDQRGVAIDGAVLKTDDGGAALCEDGYYILIHAAGSFTLTVSAEGYLNYSSEITVTGGQAVTKDIRMISEGSYGTPCCAEALYGEYSDEAAILREFRDDFLSKMPAGQRLVKIYYALSPAVVEALEENETLRKQFKKVTDGVLAVIKDKLHY